MTEAEDRAWAVDAHYYYEPHELYNSGVGMSAAGLKEQTANNLYQQYDGEYYAVDLWHNGKVVAHRGPDTELALLSMRQALRRRLHQDVLQGDEPMPRDLVRMLMRRLDIRASDAAKGGGDFAGAYADTIRALRSAFDHADSGNFLKLLVQFDSLLKIELKKHVGASGEES